MPAADLERHLPLPLGPHDPTRRWGPGRFWCAAHTPAGPATLAVAVEEDICLLGWGPGGAWALDRAPALLGLELLQPYQGHRFRVVRAVFERAWMRR